MSDDLKVRLSVDDKNFESGMNRARNKLDSVKDKAGKAGTAFAGLGSALGTVSASAGPAGSALGALGGGLSAVIDGALALGPTGIAITAVTTGLALAVGSFIKTREEAKKAKEELNNFVKSVEAKDLERELRKKFKGDMFEDLKVAIGKAKNELDSISVKLEAKYKEIADTIAKSTVIKTRPIDTTTTEGKEELKSKVNQAQLDQIELITREKKEALKELSYLREELWDKQIKHSESLDAKREEKHQKELERIQKEKEEKERLAKKELEEIQLQKEQQRDALEWYSDELRRQDDAKAQIAYNAKERQIELDNEYLNEAILGFEQRIELKQQEAEEELQIKREQKEKELQIEQDAIDQRREMATSLKNDLISMATQLQSFQLSLINDLSEKFGGFLANRISGEEKVNKKSRAENALTALKYVQQSLSSISQVSFAYGQMFMLRGIAKIAASEGTSPWGYIMLAAGLRLKAGGTVGAITAAGLGGALGNINTRRNRRERRFEEQQRENERAREERRQRDMGNQNQRFQNRDSSGPTIIIHHHHYGGSFGFNEDETARVISQLNEKGLILGKGV